MESVRSMCCLTVVAENVVKPTVDRKEYDGWGKPIEL